MQTPIIELSKQVFDTRYFSFGQKRESSHVPVDIFFGGLEHCSPDYRIERSGFPVYLMEYVLRGEGDLMLNGKRETLRRGCLYWYGPGISCRLVNNSKDPLVKYFFAFRCPGKSPDTAYQLQRFFIGANRGGDLVRDLVKMLYDEACAANEDSWRICCSYLDVILMKCARSQVLERNSKERAWQVFKGVKDYIEDNYLEIQRMEDVAQATHLNVSYISRLFKRYYHMTPYSLLQQKKMEYALDLLRQQNVSVQQAAEMTGFDDPFHFSRVFKRFKGISPSQMRNVAT